MEEELILEMGAALARGDVALWLGPAWRPPEDTEQIGLLAERDWLGIWSTSTSGVIAEALVESRRKDSGGRLIVEVPDRINDVLGERFSLAEICPFFYLDGKGQSRLSDRNRRVARDAKIDCLNRLGPSLLLVTGYEDPTALNDVVANEMLQAAPELQIVVLGRDGKLSNQFGDETLRALKTKVRIANLTLVELLRRLISRKLVLPGEPHVRVGSATVALRPLLRSEPPIDRDFMLLTENDIREPDAQESLEQLFGDMLGGRQAPWRALAHNLSWQREIPHYSEVRNALKELRRGGSDPQVVCLNVPAERGSGLTMLLQQIAFDAARSGHPTLVHRSPGGGLNYDLLRSFLTDLYRDLPPEAQHFAAVIIFDAAFVESDVQGILRDLPVRLARDSRRVLMVRGIPVRRLETADYRFEERERVRTRAGIQEKWLKGLSAILKSAEQATLTSWARDSLHRLGRTFPPSASELIGNWDQARDNVPLLICLYFILTAELRSAAQLGQHLVARFKEVLPPAADSPNLDAGSDRVLTGSELREALSPILQRGLGWKRAKQDELGAEDIAAVFVALAALGSLRIGAPRSVLASVAGVEPETIHRVILKLEEIDLATSDIPLVAGKKQVRDDAPHAPVAWYGGDECIGLRHPAYGRLILDWLRCAEGVADQQLLAARGLTQNLIRCFDDKSQMDDYPVRLLQPIMKRLQPTRPHVEFASDLSVRFLRLRKEKQPHAGFSEWQWRHAELLLDAFDWLHQQLVRQSSVILHSRGITRYKATHADLPPEAYRKRYHEAELDLLRALELAEESRLEHPSHILTSLGLLYLGWAARERTGGHEAEWRELDRKVEDTLRRSLTERPDNTYAIYGLAKYLVDRYRRRTTAADELSSAAQDLADALELLQAEPEAYFLDEWHELKMQAIALLSAPDAIQVIDNLKARRDELGYALEALRCLDGRIPAEPTGDKTEVTQIQQAGATLQVAASLSPLKRCNLAQLLRYALFSADPERIKNPAYQIRFDLLKELAGSIYLDRPIWRFDYGMLAFQVGKYEEGADAFAWLRRGQRYFEVPLERSQFLAKSPDSVEPRGLVLRIVSSGGADEKGWGRIDHPRFRDPVPFSVRAFRSRAKSVQLGATPTCYVRLRPSGPFAEPEAR